MLRPQADKKKIHSKNEFELCYLRHQYLRRVDYNPTEEEMLPYLGVVASQAKSTHYVYKNLFKSIGFELPDIMNIGRVHLVSYLGLFAIEKNAKKYFSFVEVHKEKFKRKPTKNVLLNKNKADFTIFLKQRMEELVRICRQKVRNIKGVRVGEYQSFYGPKKPPKNKADLLENHEKYGYRHIDPAILRTIKKRQNIASATESFRFAGYWYVTVPLVHKNLNIIDFAGAGYDPCDNIHNKTPEELLEARENTEEFERNKRAFNARTGSEKESIVREFIKKNKGNPIFKEEVQIALKYLNNIKA